MSSFCGQFLHIVLTIKFQVYLMCILGDIENQSSNFCTFLFYFGMQFYDDVTNQFSSC